jgi:hypothetical protein
MMMAGEIDGGGTLTGLALSSVPLNFGKREKKKYAYNPLLPDRFSNGTHNHSHPNISDTLFFSP